MAEKSYLIRESSKKAQRKTSSFSEQLEINGKLHSLPRNSTPTRPHRRCPSTGRARTNYRDFGLSGYILREIVCAGLLTGATRSNW